jgi:hypothetical protein
MKSTLLSGSILLVSSLLAAQTAPQAATPSATRLAPATLPAAAPASSCPVSLHALQGTGSGLLAVRNADPVPGPLQHIHLVLGNGNASRPVTAKIIVRGLSDKSRTLLSTQLSNAERFDNTRTLYVTFTPENGNDVAADLALPGFTSVSSIRLESIGYADGSTWKIATGQVCRVVPDPLMLVADR